MYSGKTIETGVSVKMEASLKMDSDGNTQSQSKITENKTNYKVNGVETQNFMNEAIEKGICVITGY